MCLGVANSNIRNEHEERVKRINDMKWMKKVWIALLNLNYKMTKLIQNIISKIQSLSFLRLSLIIFILGFFVYGNTLLNGFVWDDEEQIVNNTLIQNIQNFPTLFNGSTFNTAGTGSLSGIYYKPLMPLSFMVNFAIWGKNAFGFHLFQIILHFLNAILLFKLFIKIFEVQKILKSKFFAFIVTIFFVVHPGISEAVSYLSSTQEVIFTFFSLLAFLFCIKYLENYKLQNWIFFSIFLFLGLLGKESAIIIIPIVIFYFFLFARSKIIFPILFTIPSVVLYSFLRFVVAKIPFGTSHVVPIAQASLMERLFTIPFELFSYLRLFFFPKDLFISQHFIIYQITDPHFWGLSIILIIFIIFIAFIWIKLLKKDKLFLFFFAWSCFSFLLLFNLFPLDMTVAERWLYFPSIGIFGMMAIVFTKIKFKKEFEKIIFYLFLGILVIFAGRTILRNQNWQNGLMLYANDIKLNSNAFDLQNNYGVELFRSGNKNKAKIHFEKSVVLEPKWWTNYSNLGVIFEQQGNEQKAEKLYKQALENNDYYLALENLASLYLRQARYSEAISFCQKYLIVMPYNLKLNYTLAISLYQIGRTEEALKYIYIAYQLYPDSQIKNLLTLMQQESKLNLK